MIGLPPEWVRQGYGLRKARARDRTFQRMLFGLARPDAALIARWPAPQREAFLDRQFALQDIHYRRYFADADVLILTRLGMPVGRLILQRQTREWRVIDIGLMPDERGRGLGTALLRSLQADCRAAGARALSLQVEITNRAQALYARLGFAETGSSGSHIAMTWTAADQLKTAS